MTPGAAPSRPVAPPALGLQSRLLLGLAVLVFVAIASTGWLTLEVARGRLEAVELERARGLGAAVAGMLGGALPSADGPARVAAALSGVEGLRDLAAIDAQHRALWGEPGGDARLLAALGGETWAERDSRGAVAVYAPLRRGGAVVGAVRLRVAVGDALRDASRGSRFLLLGLTLVDGGLILVFGALFLRQVTRPLRALGRAALRVAEGELDVAPLPPEQGELGTLIDSFNRMTRSLAEQQRGLADSRAQVVAQEKLATVGRMAAGIAHEVGNPLTAVLGYVDLLLLDEQQPAARDLLERIKAETGRIHRLVHDLLDYARPVDEEVEPVGWAEVVDTAEGLLRPQPRFKAVTVPRHLPPDLPPVAGSTRHLLQVTLNLLLNAADAMGGAGEVRVSARAEGDDVVLDVHDSGPGVAPESAERIFDPFFSTKPPGAGSGLGLAVCRSIIEAYHGRIALVPSETGACLRVTLPRWR